MWGHTAAIPISRTPPLSFHIRCILPLVCVCLWSVCLSLSYPPHLWCLVWPYADGAVHVKIVGLDRAENEDTGVFVVFKVIRVAGSPTGRERAMLNVFGFSCLGGAKRARRSRSSCKGVSSQLRPRNEAFSLADIYAGGGLNLSERRTI